MILLVSSHLLENFRAEVARAAGGLRVGVRSCYGVEVVGGRAVARRAAAYELKCVAATGLRW